MPRRTDTTIVAVKLRIREGLRKKLLREAEKADHSLNQELERRLERSFELEQMDERLEALMFKQFELDKAGARISKMSDQLSEQLDAVKAALRVAEAKAPKVAKRRPSAKKREAQDG